MTSLLLRSARLVALATYDVPPDHPVDVLVEDGVVTRVGPDLDRSAGIEEVDAEGRWLIPGLWDQHVHLGQWAQAGKRLDTSRARSPEQAIALAADRVATAPGIPVIGWGHRPATWTRQGTAAELDEVSGITPVILVAGDGHHAWLNSAAQAALGLPHREGVVAEDEWYAAYRLLDGLAPITDADYATTLQQAAAMGVVGLVDLEFVADLDAWRERWGNGCDLLRVRAATYAEGLEPAIDQHLRTGTPLLEGDDRLTMGPLKIISDGSLNTRTAWCHQPYAHDPHPDSPQGAPNVGTHELTALLARAHSHGFEVATHAIGDAAIDQALDAYALTHARGSIEHAQLITDKAIARLAQLPVRASVQPHHLVDDRDLIDLTWPGRGGRAYAFRSLLDAGVELALGSDAPVSPLDPWLAIDAAVRRTGDDRPAWHPEQALTRQEALAASTDGQPMVAVGSRGDLVLLEDDPLTTTRPGVALTVVAGRITHRS
ncbi:amidohydrolase [Nocardioides montaniterrae]